LKNNKQNTLGLGTFSQDFKVIVFVNLVMSIKSRMAQFYDTIQRIGVN